MTLRDYRPGLHVYYRTADGDTIPAITISRWINRRTRRVTIEGDFILGREHRSVSIDNLTPQTEAGIGKL